MPKSSQPGESDPPPVPWADIVKFVRQLSHDIRNNLNVVELQSAFLAELATDDEMKSEVQHLRQMVSQVGSNLQHLTAGLSQSKPNAISYKATDFVEDLQQKLAKEMPEQATKIVWEMKLADGTVHLDPFLAQQALLELFKNAFQHGESAMQITAKAYIDKDCFVFELIEPKANFTGSTETWGREPLRSTSQGHYGLGLNRVRAISEAHGGEFRAKYDRSASTLTTTIMLPLEKS
jgi:K+-sensing histidine kinase KdpD